MTDQPTPLTGEQMHLRSGRYAATIVTVGASLRVLRHRSRDLVVPFAADQVRPVYRGAILAPWPNRVVDGRYVFEESIEQLALTEPDRGHALHGLVAWADFDVRRRGSDWVELTTSVPAQAGYPHPLLVLVRYELADSGLLTTVTGTNQGADPVPWGTGPHPYLVAGPGLVDDWRLVLPARQVLTVTTDRLVPVAVGAVDEVEGGRYDFRGGRRIGDTEIDHAFTGLDRRGDNLAVVDLLTAAGEGVRMSWDERCSWVQVHTADRPDPAEHRIGLAVEPMTCAPDAFNSGRGLIHLAPGESTTARWRIEALGS